MNADIDAGQGYADAGAVNYRRRIIVRRRRIIVRRAVDHRRRGIITTTPAAISTITASITASALLRASRGDKRSEHKKGGDCEPHRELRRKVAFRFGVDDAGHGDLL